MSACAPIVLFVYNRPDHVRETWTALQACPEAGESHLYVFSDGPKNENATSAVLSVRATVAELTEALPFGQVTVVESPVNKGLAASVISGVTEVMKAHGRAIVLEDDCRVSPYFLTYMNRCLDAYATDASVGAVAGYVPTLSLPADYTADVFATYRSCSCAWATWADRWDGVDWELKGFGDFCSDPANIKRLNLNGDDRFLRLYRQTLGNGTSWSVRFGMHLVKNNWLTVYSRYSYIENIGCDASGVHSTAEDADKMAVDLGRAIADPHPVSVTADPAIQKIMKKHYSDGFLSTVKRRVATAWYVHKVKRSNQ